MHARIFGYQNCTKPRKRDEQLNYSLQYGIVNVYAASGEQRPQASVSRGFRKAFKHKGRKFHQCISTPYLSRGRDNAQSIRSEVEFLAGTTREPQETRSSFNASRKD